MITKFNSIKEWKNCCFNTHNIYIKNSHFKKWIHTKNIHLFNLSNLARTDVNYIKFGIEDAIKTARLNFRINYPKSKNLKKNTISKNKIISSIELLKMVIEKRKENQNANILIFNNPIKSLNATIKDGEALTYVSEGVMVFTFDTSSKYSHNFLRRRAKHEALHLLGLNSHHEDIKVSDYKYNTLCNMNYNAPTMHLCEKCKTALISFWKVIEHATGKQFVVN